MSDNKINKSSLKEAKANFEEIKKFALEEATKNLQEDVSKKVIELMNNIDDKEVVKEEVKIEADGTTIIIDNNGEIKLNPQGQSTEHIFSSEVNSEEEEEEDDEEIFVSDEDDEVEIEEDMNYENLDEMNFEEQEEVVDASQNPAPEVAAVAPEVAPEEIDMDAEVADDSMSNPFEMLSQKLDTLIGLMGGQESGNDEIDIVDDTEEMGAAPEMAPAPAPAPMGEEITFEVVNNEMEMPGDDVLEIVGEIDDEFSDDEPIEEMLGVGHNLRHSNRLAILPGQGVEHRKEMNENKAQYEAKLAELIKENESLKLEKKELEEGLIKFENGFIKLQENFGEMEDYNAKLVMAYKVAMSGGLTNDEKIQISEQFDACKSVEEAEKLYKSIVSEHKIRVNKNPEKSIKSNIIKTTPANSVSKPLYESKEILRMKKLAGIKKTED